MNTKALFGTCFLKTVKKKVEKGKQENTLNNKKT